MRDGRKVPALLACGLLIVAFAAVFGGCAHGVLGPPEFSDNTADRLDNSGAGDRLKTQVLAFDDCPKLDALRRFERGLFKVGFVREMMREDTPVPFELVDRLMSSDAQLVSFQKSDFEPVKVHGSIPYREIVNRYKLVACEENGGGLYLIVLRLGVDPKDKFLGDRFEEALKASECRITPVAAVRDLGVYADTTEDDLLRHVRRGRCREYGAAP